MNVITRKLGLLALLVALAPVGVALAQSGTPTTTGPTPTAATDPTQVPIDGGASLLLAGGVALGIKKLRARRRA